MTERSNEEVVRKFYQGYNTVAREYHGKHEPPNFDTLLDAHALMDLFAHDVTWVDPSGITHNKEGMRKVMREFFVEPFSDQRWTPNRVVTKGDTVMVEYSWSGKHVKDLAGIPAKGKRFEAHGAEVYVLEAGKIKLYKTYSNPNPMMQQLQKE